MSKINCSLTKNFIMEFSRMTEDCENISFCSCGCPYDKAAKKIKEEQKKKEYICNDFIADFPEQAIQILQDWSNKHPKMTYLEKVLKEFPETKLNKDGIPQFCPHLLGFPLPNYNEVNLIEKICKNKDYKKCIDCWNRYVSY